MKRIGPYLSLRKKANLFALVFLVYLSLSAYVLYQKAIILNDIAYYVNASGKTRMLSQRIVGQTFLFLKNTGQTKESARTKLQKALEEHRICSDFLINGGAVKFSTEAAQVSPITDNEVLRSAMVAKKVFETQTQPIQNLLNNSAKDTNSVLNETHFFTSFNNDSLLQNNIRVTDLFQRLASTTRRNFEQTLFIIGCIGFLLILGSYLLVFNYFTKVIRQLRIVTYNLKQMGLLSQHDHHQHINDELLELNNTFNSINANLNEINNLCNELSKGNFDVLTLNKTIKTYELLPDNLIYSLENMRVNLKTLTEGETKQRLEIQNLLAHTEEINETLKTKEEALHQSNLHLTENNEYLEAFNSGLAHDLKNHAGNIMSMVSLLKKYEALKDWERIQQITIKLEKSTAQFISILNGFMYLSRTNTYLEKSPEYLNARLLTDAIHLELDYLLNEEHVTIHYSIEIENLMYSKHFLKIILVNLISNAIKYKRPGVKAQVEVVLKLIQDSIHISVADNGIGIAKKDAEQKLFKMFARLNADDSTITGSGIGLYLIKKMVERKNGSITFTSTVGVGTTFTVTIPLT